MAYIKEEKALRDTNEQKANAEVLEIVDGGGSRGACEGGVSNENKGCVSRSRARFHYIFPDVTCSSDEQDATLIRHLFKMKKKTRIDSKHSGAAAEGD